MQHQAAHVVEPGPFLVATRQHDAPFYLSPGPLDLSQRQESERSHFRRRCFRGRLRQETERGLGMSSVDGSPRTERLQTSALIGGESVPLEFVQNDLHARPVPATSLEVGREQAGFRLVGKTFEQPNGPIELAATPKGARRREPEVERQALELFHRCKHRFIDGGFLQEERAADGILRSGRGPSGVRSTEPSPRHTAKAGPTHQVEDSCAELVIGHCVEFELRRMGTEGTAEQTPALMAGQLSQAFRQSWLRRAQLEAEALTPTQEVDPSRQPGPTLPADVHID
jgi:hypothetical protein